MNSLLRLGNAYWSSVQNIFVFPCTIPSLNIFYFPITHHFLLSLTLSPVFKWLHTEDTERSGGFPRSELRALCLMLYRAPPAVAIVFSYLYLLNKFVRITGYKSSNSKEGKWMTNMKGRRRDLFNWTILLNFLNLNKKYCSLSQLSRPKHLSSLAYYTSITVIAANMRLNRMPTRLEGNVRKYDGGGKRNGSEKCAEIHPWEIVPWPRCSESQSRTIFYSRDLIHTLCCFPHVELRISVNKILVV
jgi:hypothetical protein